jgi:hypothetical protein
MTKHLQDYMMMKLVMEQVLVLEQEQGLVQAMFHCNLVFHFVELSHIPIL